MPRTHLLLMMTVLVLTGIVAVTLQALAPPAGPAGLSTAQLSPTQAPAPLTQAERAARFAKIFQQ